MTVRELVSPTTRFASVRTREPSQSKEKELTAVLADLFEFLEEYGPTWYTEDEHNRVVSALSEVNSPIRHALEDEA